MKKKVKIICRSLLIILLVALIITKRNDIKVFVCRMFSPEVDLGLKEYYVKDYLNVDRLTEYDLKKLDKFYCNGTQVKYLKELPNLKYLTVDNTDDEALIEIGKQTSLETLAIDGSYTDLSPLESLTNLKYLNLVNNENVDLTPIGKLIQLEQVSIMLGDDISCLSNLKNLEYLDLSYMKTTDISPIANLTKLVRIRLDNMKNIEDITPISRLSEMKVLEIWDCPMVTDISAIKDLNKLEKFHISRTSVTDISVLKDLSDYPNLLWVLVDENQLDDQQQWKIIADVTSKRDNRYKEFKWKYEMVRSLEYYD